MPDQTRLVQELRELIARKEVVLVVGTGVSLSDTKGSAAASWRGLLLSGVKRFVELTPTLAGRSTMNPPRRTRSPRRNGSPWWSDAAGGS